MFFSMLILYGLGRTVFKDKTLALVAVLIFTRLPFFPVMKYREFTLYILWPLFFYAVYKMLETRRLSWGAIAGATWGIGSLSHMDFFPMAIFFAPILGIFMYVVDFVFQKEGSFKVNREKIKREWHKPVILLLVFFVVGFALAMPYWFQPVFVYKGHVPNPEPELRHVDFSKPATYMPYFGNHFKNLWFKFGDDNSPFIWGIVSAFTLLATLFLFLLRNFGFREKFIVLMMISAFFIPLHFILTVPIMGFHMDPYLMELFWYRILAVFTVPFAILAITHAGKKFGFVKFLPYAVLLLLIIGNITDFRQRASTYSWYQTGKQPLSPYLLEVSDWIIKTTNVEDMFIAPKEVGSAMNALTGRKFLAVRGNQESLISPVFIRQGELAVMLYGNNSEQTKALLKKYNVKYLYWDYYWLQAEFQFDNSGKLIGYFDPLYIMDSQDSRNYFTQNGVLFKPENMGIDPSSRDNPLVPKWNILVAYPPQFDAGHPWSYSLDEFLVEVKSFSYNGQTIAKVFAVQV
jgi:hypothetical protein